MAFQYKNQKRAELYEPETDYEKKPKQTVPKPTPAPVQKPESTDTPKTEVPTTQTSTNVFKPSSDAYKQANAILSQMINNKPGAWVDPYLDQRLGYLRAYEDREPFSYDINQDALYNQFKDLYIQQGNLASMDTMGRAAAMTGGYGNSYAQTAGQQVYNQYLGQLNAMVPELYDQAYNRYLQEGNEMLDQYDRYTQMSQQDYLQYGDKVDNYYNDLNAAQNNVNDLYEKEYEQWMDSLPEYTELTNEDDAYWNKEFMKAIQSGSEEAIDRVADRMEARRFDPYLIAQWRNHYINELNQ